MRHQTTNRHLKSCATTAASCCPGAGDAQMNRQLLAAAFLAVVVSGCMGRAPEPVATVQPQDAMMNCTAIYAEIQGNNHRINELGREKGWKTAQNVAAGVGGLVVPVLWFGMDWQGAAGTEARALQDRQSYLGALAVQKHCGGTPPAPRR